MKNTPRTLALMALVLLALEMFIGAGDADAVNPPAATQPSSTVGTAASSAAIPALPMGGNVAIIPVDGIIYDFTLESLQRRAELAKKDGATLIVLELNTDGGLVTSALDISREVKLLGVPVIAWINRRAYSAGILIASSCDAIVMNPVAATGDCAPIVPGASLAPTERAKALSPILSEFRANARRNHYEYPVFHAMCELGIEVYLVENRATGQTALVNQADKRVMVDGETPDGVRKTLAQMAASAAQNAPPTPMPAPNPTPTPQLPAIPGVTAPAAPVVTNDLPGLGIEVATDADTGQWKLVKQLHDGKTLLTVSANEAVEFHLSRGTVATEADLAKMLGAASVKTYAHTVFETIGAFLTLPIVRGILIVIMLVGAYLEAQSPGLVIPGSLAAIALVLLLAGPFFAGMGEFWHLIVIGIGIAMLIYELVTMTFGVIGVLGIIFMIVGLALSIVPTAHGVGLPAAEMWDRLMQSVIWAMAGFICSAIGAVQGIITHYMGALPVFRRLVHHNPRNMAVHDAMGAGALSGAGIMSEPISGGDAVGQGLLRAGMTGQTTTQLRPGGRAMIGDAEIDVETLGSWVDVGCPVRIIEVAGNRIVVEKI